MWCIWIGVFGICLGAYLAYRYRDQAALLPQLLEKQEHPASVIAMTEPDSAEHARSLQWIGFAALAFGGALCAFGFCATSQKARHDVVVPHLTVSVSGRVELSSPEPEPPTSMERTWKEMRRPPGVNGCGSWCGSFCFHSSYTLSSCRRYASSSLNTTMRAILLLLLQSFFFSTACFRAP
jgi:hypothetical protein